MRVIVIIVAVLTAFIGMELAFSMSDVRQLKVEVAALTDALDALQKQQEATPEPPKSTHQSSKEFPPAKLDKSRTPKTPKVAQPKTRDSKRQKPRRPSGPTRKGFKPCMAQPLGC